MGVPRAIRSRILTVCVVGMWQQDRDRAPTRGGVRCQESREIVGKGGATRLSCGILETSEEAAGTVMASGRSRHER